jgi:hypothetical protein
VTLGGTWVSFLIVAAVLVVMASIDATSQAAIYIGLLLLAIMWTGVLTGKTIQTQ